MKKLLPFLVLSLFVLPAFAGAHGSYNFSELRTGPQMMQYVEDQAMDAELHEEMEDLMVNMMEGDLSQQEADRLSELMQQFPGPHGMMMSRLSNSYYQDKDWNNMGWGMHNGFGNWSGMFWLIFLSALVWLVVGIMVIVYLGKRIGEDK